MLSESVTKLVEEFAKLPGIGKKSAERLAYHILRIHQSEAAALAEAIRSVKENVRYCRNCYNLTEQEECEVCRDSRRDRTQLCVVVICPQLGHAPQSTTATCGGQSGQQPVQAPATHAQVALQVEMPAKPHVHA